MCYADKNANAEIARGEDENDTIERSSGTTHCGDHTGFLSFIYLLERFDDQLSGVGIGGDAGDL
jgi:hypothetical protein